MTWRSDKSTPATSNGSWINAFQTSDARAASLIVFVSNSVAQLRGRETFSFAFDRAFRDDIYAAMVDTMPNAADYRPLWGRNKGNMRDDES